MVITIDVTKKYIITADQKDIVYLLTLLEDAAVEKLLVYWSVEGQEILAQWRDMAKESYEREN